MYLLKLKVCLWRMDIELVLFLTTTRSFLSVNVIVINNDWYNKSCYIRIVHT